MTRNMKRRDFLAKSSVVGAGLFAAGPVQAEETAAYVASDNF